MVHRTRVVCACVLTCMVLVAAVSCSRLSPEQKALHEGLLRMHERNYEQAEEMFRRCLELNPNYMDAYIQLSLCYQYQLEYASATAVLSEAIAVDPDNREAYARKANTQAAIGDGAGMLETVDEIESRFGVDMRSKVLRGRAFELQRDKLDEALAAFNAAIELDKGYADAYRGQARVYVAQDKLDDARRSLQALLAVAPDDLEAAVQLALIEAQQGKLEEAKTSLDALLVTHANNPAVLTALSQIALEQKDFDKAQQYARSALEVQRNNPMANYIFGVCLLEQNRANEALQFLQAAARFMPGNEELQEKLAAARSGAAPMRQVGEMAERLAAEPDNAELQLEVATRYLKMGWASEADAPSAAALRLLPDRRDAVLVRLLVLATLRNRDEAMALLADHPPAPNDNLMMAIEAHMQGDLERARTLAERAAQLPQDEAWARYVLGAAHVGLRNLREAVQEFDNCFEADSSMSIALLNRAQLYERLGLITPALSTYGVILRLNPDDPRILLRTATLLDLRGSKADAERFIQAALQLAPDNPDALMLLAVHHERYREYQKAITQYLKLLGQRPDDVRVKLRLANLRAINEEFSVAIDLFGEVLQASPGFLPAQVSIGLARAAQDQFDASAKVYEQVLDASPGHHLAKVHLAAVRQMLGQYDAALELLNQLLAQGTPPEQLAPQRFNLHLARQEYELAAQAIEDSTAAADYKALARLVIGACRQDGYNPSRLVLGRALAGAGWIPSAIKQYQQIASEQSRNALAHTALGELHLAQEDYERALNAFNLALIQYENSAYLHRRMGEIHLLLKQPAEAGRHLERSVALDPNNASALLSLSQIYEGAGKRVEAQNLYRQVIALAPDDPIAYNNLAYNLASDRTTLEQALGYAKQAVQLRPADGDIQDTLGWIYFLVAESVSDPEQREKHYKLALQHFENALTLVPDQPTVTFHFARVLDRLGRLKEAAAMYRRSVRLDPNFPERTEAADAITRLQQQGF